MRKLIRYSALAFLVWAVTTFAWAALSHATGLVGPAEASGASLRFVASAVTFVDPPGVLGAPQRFAASQIRHAARAVERVHRGPERAMSRLMDRLGHDARHRGLHRHRHALRIERQGRSVEIPLDELDGARERAMARARIELERHRRDLERQRAGFDRQRWRQEVEARRQEVEVRRREIEQRRIELDRQRQEHLERRLQSVRERLERVQVEQQGEFRRKLVERLREILRELERELEDARADQDIEIDASELSARILESIGVQIEGIGQDLSADAPVTIRIRGDGN